MIKVRLIKNKEEYNKVLNIRKKVFIEEQKVSKEIEIDKYEKEAKHIICFYKEKVVGCARVRWKDNKLKLERIAVLKQYRSKGIGKAIVKYLISYSKRVKAKEVFMNAQYYLLEYYNKLGFKTRGKIFYEAKIKHIQMYVRH